MRRFQRGSFRPTSITRRTISTRTRSRKTAGFSFPSYSIRKVQLRSRSCSTGRRPCTSRQQRWAVTDADEIPDLQHAALERAADECPTFLAQACQGRRRAAPRGRVAAAARVGCDTVSRDGAHVHAGPGSPAPSSMVSRQLGRTRSSRRLAPAALAKCTARETVSSVDVAMKILPSHFTEDPERRARFAREARLLATLNPPTSARFTGSKKRTASPAWCLSHAPRAHCSRDSIRFVRYSCGARPRTPATHNETCALASSTRRLESAPSLAKRAFWVWFGRDRATTHACDLHPRCILRLTSGAGSGEPRRNRTVNPQIKSLLLCQLS